MIRRRYSGSDERTNFVERIRPERIRSYPKFPESRAIESSANLETKRSNLSPYKRIRVVLGNPTCDLDSAVCALAQGLSEYMDGKKKDETDLAVIPLMNIPEREFRVKTEVVYYLNRHNIPSSLLTFRDQIDLRSLKDDARIYLEVILVDHHSLPDEDLFLAESVVEVIDHRPRDAAWPWPGRTVCLETVGSCASLVARNLLRKHPEVLDAQLSSLLRGPILIDTYNFSKEADRATPVDVEAIEALERVGALQSARTEVLDQIVAAKTDISELTPDDLMIRDLKVTAGVPIVGLPMLVENFLSLEGVLKAIKTFAESRKTKIVVLMGLELKAQKIARDIAIFSWNSDHRKSDITKALTSSTKPILELTLSREIIDDEGKCSLLLYKQGNLRATRKHVLPIIRDAISAECPC